MNKREADRLAKEKYGWTASAVRASNPLDRNQRYGIAYIEPGGITKDGKRGSPFLHILGYGDSFPSAFAMAEGNPVAQAAAVQWELTKKEWERMKENPHEVVEEMMNALKEAKDGE